MILIGYEGESTNYGLMEPNNPKKVIVSANVKFHQETKCEIELEETSKLQIIQEENEEESVDTEVEQDVVVEENTAVNGRRYELRNREVLRQPDRFEANLIEFEEPSTYADAMASSTAKEWREAIDAELQALEKNKTWITSTLPKKRKALSSK